MALSFFLKEKKGIIARCRDDYVTKMRLRYAPHLACYDACVYPDLWSTWDLTGVFDVVIRPGL